MSPALKHIIHKIAGAGLLVAAAACVADDTSVTAPLPQSDVVVTASAASISVNALENNQAAPAPPASDTLPSNTSAVNKTVTPAMNTPASNLPTNNLPTNNLPTNNASTTSSTTTNLAAYYQNANSKSPKIGSGGHLLNVTLGLLLIIGLIFGLSWFVKRFSHGTFTGNAHLKIIATMPLGTRERIALIDAGGQQLLLGITPTQINTLHVFDVPVTTPVGDVNNSDFGRKLMAILQRPNTNDESGNNNSGIRG
jgi:flagellar protein FliO/FliZ